MQSVETTLTVNKIVAYQGFLQKPNTRMIQVGCHAFVTSAIHGVDIVCEWDEYGCLLTQFHVMEGKAFPVKDALETLIQNVVAPYLVCGQSSHKG